MPTHKSAEKRMETNAKSNLRNRMFISSVRTAIKAVQSAKGKEEAAKKLQFALALIDKAAGKGVLHANNAARKKSRLSHFVKKMA